MLIVESCDMPTLYQLCLTNRDLYDLASPALWRTIDFVPLNPGRARLDLAEWQRRFFAHCDVWRHEHPERWRVLAARVETLRLPRLAGPLISHQSLKHPDVFNESELYCGPASTTIFNIIACLPRLRTLSLFLKNDWEGPREGEVQALKRVLAGVTSLRIGGQIDVGYVQALLSYPEAIEDLSLINIVEQCGQEYGPNPMLFLKPVQQRFTSLKSLHLSKIGDIDIGDEYDPELERASLEEWAGLLRGASKTLIDLTLEICYSGFRRGPDQEETERGLHSGEQFKEIILPVLQGTEWERLESLTFIGLDDMNPIDGLPERVDVEYRPEREVTYNWDVTPLEVSPPNGIFVD